MARKVSISQFNSMIRQAQSKQRQAIQKYNNEVNKHNRDVKRSVDNYNREVRVHNSRVRSDRQRFNAAVQKLERAARTPQRVTYTVRSETLVRSYRSLEQRSANGTYSERFNEVLDLAEREAANSVELETALGEEPTDLKSEPNFTADPQLIGQLEKIETDLADRWTGALYSLSPKNPDASRHFCTSAREIFGRILDLTAPNQLVMDALPSEKLTPNGTPTRRSKIKFLLLQNGLEDEALENFIEDDVENIVSLFKIFNDGTHGASGKYDTTQLTSIKVRVENGLQFLTKFAAF